AFDAVDDWRELPSMAAARARVEQGYRSAARADVVTSVSPVLTARLAADYGLRATTVPNGVDPAPGAGPVPAGLPAAPFAVYVGTLQQRVDLDLVAAAAEQVPVVVAGRATPECAARLERLPVHWLGPVPVGAVPGLLRAASAGLVPHHRDRLTESMAPMKALEYAAAGLPVVSTSVPGLDGVPRVTVADDAAGFARAALDAVGEGRRQPPAGWVDDRSWDRVADRLLSLVTGRSS
ncbi:MAG: glycosyltransferase, partial [Mycobacteriales bacterium]